MRKRNESVFYRFRKQLIKSNAIKLWKFLINEFYIETNSRNESKIRIS